MSSDKVKNEETCEQDLFLGAHGIPPNCVTTISPDQADNLLKNDGVKQPSPALQKAFQNRKKNQAKSRAAN